MNGTHLIGKHIAAIDKYLFKPTVEIKLVRVKNRIITPPVLFFRFTAN